jgi:hypothetical protein
MNRKILYALLALLPGIFFSGNDLFSQQKEREAEVLSTLSETKGTSLEIIFHKGKEHYHPLMAIWIEDTLGNYIHTLYVARSMAKGVFSHAQYKEGNWKPGEKRIPSALPYWSHKRNIPGPDSLYIPTADNPLPDAYTGATPKDDFILKTNVEDSVGEKFKVLFEINQAWDWNKYWYNSRYPGNKEYLKSAQPALVYEAIIDQTDEKNNFSMKPIGHSHPYGATGKLFRDLSTLSSALKIAEQITIRITSPE